MPPLTKFVISYDLEPRYIARVRETYPDIDVVVCPDRAQLPEALPGAQGMLGNTLTPELLRQSPDLRWVQTTGAGVDGTLFPELIESDVIVTNNSGVHAASIPEHLLALMLSFARGLPELLRYQVRHEWHFPDRGVFELGNQTLGVVGLGATGSGLAWRASALGMRVIGLRRRSGEPPRGVEKVYLQDQLHDLLRESDHVAICLPRTHRTASMFGPAEFAAMRPTAYIYNIGRGDIIDQDALIAALRAGEIAGAGLDVTDPEPLPSDSPLWDMPNVQITCHTSGKSQNYWDRGIEILLANIGRFRGDEPMINLVDKSEGY